MRFPVSVKTVALFGLIIGLPLLALPVAARLIEVRLNGGPPDDQRAAPLLAGDAQAVIEPMFVERVSPASFDEAASDGSAGALQSAGLDGAGLPPVAPPAAFGAPVAPSRASAAVDDEIQIDEQTIARLQQIRQRLEELGADYVIVETTDTAAKFRFHCRMIVDANSPFTRPFDATSPDPLAAGEQVLRDVEAWRIAAIEKQTQQK